MAAEYMAKGVNMVGPQLDEGHTSGDRKAGARHDIAEELAVVAEEEADSLFGPDSKGQVEAVVVGVDVGNDKQVVAAAVQVKAKVSNLDAAVGRHDSQQVAGDIRYCKGPEDNSVLDWWAGQEEHRIW